MIYLSAHLPENYRQASTEMMVEQSHGIISPAICDDRNRKHWLVTADVFIHSLFSGFAKGDLTCFSSYKIIILVEK